MMNNYCASVVKNAMYMREMFKQVVYKIEEEDGVHGWTSDAHDWASSIHDWKSRCRIVE